MSHGTRRRPDERAQTPHDDGRRPATNTSETTARPARPSAARARDRRQPRTIADDFDCTRWRFDCERGSSAPISIFFCFSPLLICKMHLLRCERNRFNATQRRRVRMKTSHGVRARNILRTNVTARVERGPRGPKKCRTRPNIILPPEFIGSVLHAFHWFPLNTNDRENRKCIRNCAIPLVSSRIEKCRFFRKFISIGKIIDRLLSYRSPSPPFGFSTEK